MSCHESFSPDLLSESFDPLSLTVLERDNFKIDTRSISQQNCDLSNLHPVEVGVASTFDFEDEELWDAYEDLASAPILCY